MNSINFLKVIVEKQYLFLTIKKVNMYINLIARILIIILSSLSTKKKILSTSSL